MIQIKLDSGYLDLNENTKITLEYNNPVFTSVKELAKNFSYNFDIPATDTNKKLLKFPFEIDNAFDFLPQAAEIQFSDDTIISGDITVVDAGYRSIKVAFEQNKRLDWANNFLSDYDYSKGVYIINTSDIGEIGVVAVGTQGSDYTVAVEVEGILYTATKAETGTNFVGDLATVLVNKINADTGTHGVTASVVGLPIFDFTPADGKEIKIRNDLSEGNVYLIYTCDVTTQSSLIAQMDAVTAETDLDVYDYRFPQVTAKSLSIADNVVINKYNGTTHNIAYDELNLPCVFLRRALKRIAEANGWNVSSTFLDAVSYRQRLLIINNTYYQEDHKQGLGQGQNKYVFLQDLLPRLSLLDFLQALTEFFNLYVEFDHDLQEIRIETVNDVLSNSDTPYTFDYDPDSIRVASRKYPRWLLTNNYNGDFAEQFDFVEAGDLTVSEVTEVNPTVNYIPNVDNSTAPNDDQRPNIYNGFPEINSDLNSPDWYLVPTAGSKIDFTLLYYTDDAAAGYDYDTHTLRWKDYDGRTGRYTEFWKSWVEALKDAKVISVTLFIPVYELQNINLLRKISIEGDTFLIRKIRIGLTNRGITPAKAELIRLLV